MDGGRFRALPESYLNSPPLANTTEEERRFTLSGPTLRSPSQRATSCQRGASALRVAGGGYKIADDGERHRCHKTEKHDDTVHACKCSLEWKQW